MRIISQADLEASVELSRQGALRRPGVRNLSRSGLEGAGLDTGGVVTILGLRVLLDARMPLGIRSIPLAGLPWCILTAQYKSLLLAMPVLTRLPAPE